MTRSRSRIRTLTTRIAIALSAPAIAISAIAAGGAFSGGTAQPARAANRITAVQSAGTARAGGDHGTTATQSATVLATSRVRLTRNQRIAWKIMNNRFPWRPRYQFRPLRKLWNRESGWRVRAYNPYSGAYGIPQAVPGSKMGSVASNWRYSARTQIRWGLRYIRSRYGSPRRAWRHECATGWY